MCGISGFVNLDNRFALSSNEGIATIKKMLSVIDHRGPDSDGHWHNSSKKIFLGHKRLAILDLSKNGHQPMHSLSQRYTISFNGEIYNHLSLRDELNKIINHSWQGTSDTETILACLDFWGLENTLPKLTGMFAISIWDHKENSLYLTRDRMGEKPLYFVTNSLTNPEFFAFSSDVESFNFFKGFRRKINEKSVSALLQMGYIPAPLSIYHDCYKINPSSVLKLSLSNLEISFSNYWDQSEKFNAKLFDDAEFSDTNIIETLEKKLKTVITNQLISDVPIGAFLSGGIDSSLIVSLMQSISNKPVKTFSIGFTDKQFDESVYAKKIAAHLGTEHHELIVDPNMAMNVIPSLPSVYSEPFADSSQVPTFLVSMLAKEKVTVSLSGDGGDELFCGYNRYSYTYKLWKYIQLMPMSIRRLISSGLLTLSPSLINSLARIATFSNSKVLNFNLGDKINKGARSLKSESILDVYFELIKIGEDKNLLSDHYSISSEYSKHLKDIVTDNPIEQMMYLDANTYLPDDILTKVDRASMYHSLESRVPFLDRSIVEYAWKLPMKYKYRAGESKWILRKILSKYIPPELYIRPKMGFGIPIGEWIRGPLNDWANDLLNKKSIEDVGVLNFKYANQLLKTHCKGHRNLESNLWPILMFQSWALSKKDFL